MQFHVDSPSPQTLGEPSLYTLNKGGVTGEEHTDGHTDIPQSIGAHDEAAQRAWENYQVTRGIARYRQSLTREVQRGARAGERVSRALSDLEPGQRIADDLIVPLTNVIAARQAAAAEAMSHPDHKKTSDEHWILLSLPAEVLGVVTVLAALSRTDAVALNAAASDLGSRVMHEVEMRVWAEREKEAEKERKEGKTPDAPNLYSLMVRRNDRVDERVFQKWSKKAPLFVHGGWSVETRKRIGVALLGLLVELDGWFEVKTVREGIKTRHMFQLTDNARAWIAHRHNQNELTRPLLLPMICEPRDYEYLPTSQGAEEPEEVDFDALS